MRLSTSGLIVGLCVTATVAGLIGYVQGRKAVLTAEFTTYAADLVTYYSEPEARRVELEAFLKARYYYLANRVPKRYLGAPYDYGEADFRWLAIGKGPTTPRHEYERFKSLDVRFRTMQRSP
jgi:hypothetical protein